jgi:hypothetical protein
VKPRIYIFQKNIPISTTTIRATSTTPTLVKIRPKSAQNLVFFNQQTTNNKQQ